MRIAFLDLDHTLLAADSNQLWMAHLQAQGLVADAEIAQHDHFIDDYRRGRLDFAALQEFRSRIDASLGPQRLRDCLSDFARQVLLPAVAPLARELLAGLRREGLTTVVVSATRSALVDPVARHLGVDHAITSCFGADKVRRVEDWLGLHGRSLVTLSDSSFYSDSHNDLPLLEAVMRPVAVDPDATLARIATERGWPVISLLGRVGIA